MAQSGSGKKKSSSRLKWNLLLLLLAGVVFAFIQLQFWWSQFNPKWQGLQWSLTNLRIEQLALELPFGGKHQLQLEQLELSWSHWPWPLDAIKAKSVKAQLDVQPDTTAHNTKADSTEADSNEAKSPEAEGAATPLPLPALPLWLPPVLSFEQIQLSLPCARLDSRLSQHSSVPDCTLDGALTYSEQHKQLQLQLANQQPVFIEGVGDLTIALNAQLTLAVDQLQLSLLQLSLGSSTLRWQQHQLSDVKLSLTGRGLWQAERLKFEATEALKFQASYQHPQVQAAKLNLQAPTLKLELDPAHPATAKLSSDAKLEVKQLQHKQLNTLDWNWAGQLNYQQQQTELKGRLSHSQSLLLEHQVKLADQQIKVSWTLPELFFLAGNPLQFGSFWPELLTLQKGKLSGKGQLELDSHTLQLSQQQTELQLRDVSGIYDRTVFSGLNSSIKLSGIGHAWTVQTDDLRLQQVNHGVVFGPVQFNGLYNTTAPDWLKGQLHIKQLQLALFHGQVTLSPTQIDLTKDAKVLLQLDKLQLAELLKQHPGAEIQGQGTLSGTLPLSIEQGKLTVTQGSLAALKPGGFIAYQADKAQALAATNQSMNIAMQALRNFQFTVLSAGVSYSKEGQLLLALKLEGNNPDFERGRAVNFSINLEENLPAMITSLQLSSQVSDLVKKRVQQRLATQKAKDERKE